MLLNAVLSQYLWEESIFTIQWTMRVEFLFSLLVYLFAFLYWRPIFKRFRLAIHLILLTVIPIADAATSKVITSLPDPETGATGPILVSSVPTLVWYLWPFLAGLFLADLHSVGYIDAITNLWVIESTGTQQASQAKRVGYVTTSRCFNAFAAKAFCYRLSHSSQVCAVATRPCFGCHHARIISHFRAFFLHFVLVFYN